MERTQRKKTGFDRFKKVEVKPVSLAERPLVTMEPFSADRDLLLVVRPAADDVDLADWARHQRSMVEDKLQRHCAILFRGFQIDGPASFERLIGAIDDDFYSETGEHPRASVSGNVFTPVFYPPEKQLLWHNENSFNHVWPQRIAFACATPPEQGGETPVVDSRAVYRELDPELRDEFVAKGVMYVRNYGTGLGLDWQTVFRTEEMEEVERLCRANRMELEWKDGDRLCTRAVRPAVVRHPQSGEPSWFNQAQHWHMACLDPETRESIVSLYEEDDYPRDCRFGDGSPIPDDAMRSILEVYGRLETAFPWQPGDVMVVDNLLAAHGRNPFSGQRKILVAMAGAKSYDDVEVR